MEKSLESPRVVGTSQFLFAFFFFLNQTHLALLMGTQATFSSIPCHYVRPIECTQTWYIPLPCSLCKFFLPFFLAFSFCQMNGEDSRPRGQVYWMHGAWISEQLHGKHFLKVHLTRNTVVGCGLKEKEILTVLSHWNRSFFA